MIIGLLQLDFWFPEANSLKDKRRIVKSLKDRLHARFNCSVVETEPLELWRRGGIAVCIIGNDSHHVNSQLSNVVSYVEHATPAVLENYRIEML